MPLPKPRQGSILYVEWTNTQSLILVRLMKVKKSVDFEDSTKGVCVIETWNVKFDGGVGKLRGMKCKDGEM